MQVSKKPSAGSLSATKGPIREKIFPIERIGELAAKAQAGGQTVVLAHGVFDLIHVGHLRHLAEAAKMGDVLVVTLTEDEYVNKGPGRPVFTEQLRAEMLAALEIVDYVGISRHPSAEEVIETIRPDIYVKGPDYEQADDDVTGKIGTEQKTAEKHGGRIVITHDVTFSSSALINRHLDVHNPELQEFLKEARANNALDRVQAAIRSIENMKVLLVGDTIIDDYHYVTPIGKSPKENIITTLHDDREAFAGGVIATASHLATMCQQVDILTSVGQGDSQEELIRSSLPPSVGVTLIKRPGAPTVRKRRFIDPTYMRKLFEVYYMEDSSPPLDFEKEVNQAIDERISDYDVVIVNDFGHGMIMPSSISILCQKAKFLAINAQSNSGNMGFNLVTRYPRADYISIDLPEARLALANKYDDLEHLAYALIPERIDCGLIAITHGKHGCLTYQPGKEPIKIPAFTKTVIDTMGAGDAFLAATSPVAAAGAALDIVGLIGNAAGALKVGIVGHRKSVDKISLLKFLTSLLK